MTTRCLALLAVTVVVTACGHSASRTTRSGAGRPYRLYTHCGIEWARIDGTFWRAKQPLSDGSGNPPAGWGNPFQDGSLVILDPTTARFESTAGSVLFERTSRRQPPLLCS